MFTVKFITLEKSYTEIKMAKLSIFLFMIYYM